MIYLRRFYFEPVLATSPEASKWLWGRDKASELANEKSLEPEILAKYALAFHQEEPYFIYEKTGEVQEVGNPTVLGGTCIDHGYGYYFYLEPAPPCLVHLLFYWAESATNERIRSFRFAPGETVLQGRW